MPKPRTLKQVNLKKMRALVRVDFNVPWRIKFVLPTLKYLIKQKAKIILISHSGEPKGKRTKKFSLKPMSDELRELLKKKIIFSPDVVGWNVKKRIEMMGYGDVLLLENIRFNSGEEKNSPRLAKDLAALGDIFINEAFAVSHRPHASVVGIPRYLPSAIGFLFEKEIQELDKILKRPKRPLIAIIGGAKISTKLKVINKFLRIADQVLIGGALANTIFASQGIFMADSVIEKEVFPEIKKIDLKNPKLFLPIDLGIWNKNRVYYKDVSGLFEKEKALDIGPKTVNLFCNLIEKSKMLVWNGPLGLVEEKPFDKSSLEISEAIARSRAYSVAGGGDTIALIRKIKKEKAFNYLSTGGGAMLDYLANETLPGIEALRK